MHLHIKRCLETILYAFTYSVLGEINAMNTCLYHKDILDHKE